MSEAVKLLLKVVPSVVSPDFVQVLTDLTGSVDAPNMSWSGSLAVIDDAFVTAVAGNPATIGHVTMTVGVARIGTKDQAVCVRLEHQYGNDAIVLDDVWSGTVLSNRSVFVIVNTPAAREFPLTVDSVSAAVETGFNEILSKLGAK